MLQFHVKSNHRIHRFLRLFVFFVLGIAPYILPAQNYPKDYFRSPVDFSYSISGTFAEFRNDHLHTGLDIPAPMRSRVYAVADGWVYRIRIQPAGYGKVIYIAHSNGYLSVCAHLDEFSPKLEAYLKKIQYQEQTYELDYYPEGKEVTVNQGEVIAFSGNSGASTGPHLHFEIRKLEGEIPTNPLLFGLPVKDPLKPVFKTVRIYAANDDGHFLPVPAAKDYPIVRGNGVLKLKSPGVIMVPDHFILGVQAQDLDGSGNRNGLYGMTVLLDDTIWYENRMDNFSFSNFRSVNSLTDYLLYLKTHRFVQITRIADCDGLDIYNASRNHGVLKLTDDKVHKVSVLIRDYLDNTTRLEFSVKAGIKTSGEAPWKPKGTIIPCSGNGFFSKWDIKVMFPKGVLFDSLDLDYSKTEPQANLYSAGHRLQNELTPLNDFITVSVKPVNLPVELQDKACLVKLGAKGGYSYVGGGYDNGFVTGQTRKFGTFAVAVDKTPPSITPVTGKVKKIRKSKKSKKVTIIQPVRNGLTFRIGDNLSGVATYCGYVNGEWVLMERYGKGNTIFYSFDEHLKPGINKFELVVTDKKGNTATYNTDIKR